MSCHNTWLNNLGLKPNNKKKVYVCAFFPQPKRKVFIEISISLKDSLCPKIGLQIIN